MPCAIGIDIGGTHIKYGLVDHQGAILFESIRPTYRSHPLDTLLHAITETKEYATTTGLQPSGIGIGVPGIVDSGIVTACTANLPELEGIALADRMQQQPDLPIWVANDAHLMALAEWRYGAARHCTDAIFLTIGTGIGGAMLIDGQLYTGHQGRGGELGHIIVDINGKPCGCGGKGCLEAHASVKALMEDYIKEHPEQKEVTGNDIIARYRENQPAAVTALERHFKYLGAGIAGMINIFSPQKVIIGGGISEAGNDYIDAIRRRALDRAMKETSSLTSITVAALGNKAGFLGAAALVFDNVSHA